MSPGGPPQLETELPVATQANSREATTAKHPRIAVLSLALIAALASALPIARQAAAQANYDQTVAAQAAANSRAGARTLPTHVLQVPIAEISPQVQALIVGPYPPHMNADPKDAAEWKELINRRAAQDLRVYRGRHVARRVTEMQRHLVGRDVPEKLLCAGSRRFLAFAGIDQRSIGEPVDRNVCAAPRLAPAAAI